MTEFTERYRDLNNYQLFRILHERDKYQETAVETAQKELKSRQLSLKEIQSIQQRIEGEEKEKLKTARLKKESSERQKQQLSKILATLNPFQIGIQTPEKIARFITLIFGAISIYSIYNEYWAIRYMITGDNANWDLSMLLYFLPLIILPIAVYLFWKKRKWGWIVLTAYVCYFIINKLVYLIDSLRNDDVMYFIFESFVPSVPILIATILFYTGALFSLFKGGVMKLFGINKNTIIYTMISTFAFILIEVSIYFYL